MRLSQTPQNLLLDWMKSTGEALIRVFYENNKLYYRSEGISIDDFFRDFFAYCKEKGGTLPENISKQRLYHIYGCGNFPSFLAKVGAIEGSSMSKIQELVRKRVEKELHV